MVVPAVLEAKASMDSLVRLSKKNKKRKEEKEGGRKGAGRHGGAHL